MEARAELRGWLDRWFPPAILMSLIFIFSSLPGSALPDFELADFAIKKGAHLLGYALLSAAYLRALGGSGPPQPRLAWLMSVIYAGTDEFHQSFVAGRSASLWDVGIDAFGALLGLVAAAWLSRRYSPNSRS